MPTSRPITWKQISQDYPDFVAWIGATYPTVKLSSGVVDIDQYNTYKAAYGEYLQAQMALMEEASVEEPTPEA